MEINLVDLQLKQKELIKEREKLTENYKRELSDINAEINKTEYYQNLLLNNFDANKIANAKKYIYTKGFKKYFRGEAEDKLIEAIEDIATGFKIMKKEYLGCKDYDRWIGQGITCSYGMCPRHGTVVMEVGLKSDYRFNRNEISNKDACDILYFLHLLKIKENRNLLLMDRE